MDYVERMKNFEDLFNRGVERSVEQVRQFQAKKSDLQRDTNLNAAMRDEMIRTLKAPGGARDQAIQSLANTHDEAVDTLAILIKDHGKMQSKAINAWDLGKLNEAKTYYRGRIKELVNRADRNPGRTLAEEAKASGDPHKMRGVAEVLVGSGLKDITSLVKELNDAAIKGLPDADTSEADQALSEGLFAYGRMRTALKGAYQSVYSGSPGPYDALGQSLARRKLERGVDGSLKSQVFYNKAGEELARVDYKKD